MTKISEPACFFPCCQVVYLIPATLHMVMLFEIVTNITLSLLSVLLSFMILPFFSIVNTFFEFFSFSPVPISRQNETKPWFFWLCPAVLWRKLFLLPLSNKVERWASFPKKVYYFTIFSLIFSPISLVPKAVSPSEAMSAVRKPAFNTSVTACSMQLASASSPKV